MIFPLKGNENLKASVFNMIASSRLPHAIIIEGDEGTGRHTLAYFLAKSAVCEANVKPCGSCKGCSMAQSSNHPDIITVTPEDNKKSITVKKARELRADVFVKPHSAEKKVYIIDRAEHMREDAQNALLKVLEEPPEFMVFILICQNAQSLLTTVRSRCVTLTVQNPELDEAGDYIKLKTGKDEADIFEALENSHGNIGKALDILSGNAAETVAAAKEFFENFKNRDRLAALKTVYKFEKDRLGFTAFLGELRLLSQREAIKCAKGEGSVGISAMSKFLRTVEETEMTFRTHVGPPLSVQLLSATLVAEIFADL